MRLRYQQGCLRCIRRKSGPEEADTPVPTIQYGTSELDTW